MMNETITTDTQNTFYQTVNELEEAMKTQNLYSEYITLANVEIQKIPYMFTAERISCYSSDLLLREYTRLKENKKFMYSDMKKVYTIILYEKTGADFKNPLLHGAYIHHGKTRFNTELTLELLQEYFLIALDVFCQNGYTDDKNPDSRETIDSSMNELEGWLSILTAETIADVECVIRRYPWSEAIFREMSAYVNKPEEVIHMFSEALKIADKNTVKYMIEELQDKLQQTEDELQQAENKQKQESELRKQEEEKRKQAEDELQQSKEEIAQLKALLAKKQ